MQRQTRQYKAGHVEQTDCTVQGPRINMDSRNISKILLQTLHFSVAVRTTKHNLNFESCNATHPLSGPASAPLSSLRFVCLVACFLVCVFLLACLLACFLACLLACLLACVLGWLVAASLHCCANISLAS
jgi:hypothetical protein